MNLIKVIVLRKKNNVLLRKGKNTNFETENPERPSVQLPPTCCLMLNHTQSDYIFIKEVFQKML